MPNGTGNFRNFQISRKKENLERLTEIFEMNFRKFSVSLDSEPEFSEILVEWNSPSVADMTMDGRFHNFHSRGLSTLGGYRSYHNPGGATLDLQIKSPRLANSRTVINYLFSLFRCQLYLNFCGKVLLQIFHSRLPSQPSHLFVIQLRDFRHSERQNWTSESSCFVV